MKLKTLLWGIPLSILGYATVMFTEKGDLASAKSINSNTEKQIVWSSTYEKSVRDKIYRNISVLMKSESQKEEYVNCFVPKLKQTLPNGIESIPRDSLHRIYDKLDVQCLSTMKNVELNSWSPQVKKVLRDELLKNEGLKVLSDRKKLAFCDCYIENMQALYPDGITGKVPENIQEKVEEKCAKKLHLK